MISLHAEFPFLIVAAQFALNSVNVSAENVDGPAPVVRVTWNTTVPPQCVTSVRVDFRTSGHGPVAATYTTNDTSGTAVVQTGLRCDTNYYITVAIVNEETYHIHAMLNSIGVQVFVNGGKA